MNNFLKISTDGAILKDLYDETRPESVLSNALKKRRKKRRMVTPTQGLLETE